LKNDTLTVASLFSGVGGIEYGLHKAGHETLIQCESLDTANWVLKKRFPECRRHPDIRTMKSLPNADLVAAGFPCQDLSQAGLSLGIRGSQSSLVDYVFSLIAKKRKRPEWLLLENVPFMLQLHCGKAMHHLVKSVEQLGYSWAYRVVDTRSFGLPQRRRRVVFLASRNSDPKQILFADDAQPSRDFDHLGSSCGFYWTEGNTGIGWTNDGVPTLKGGSGLGIPSPPAIWKRETNEIVTIDIRDAERLQGLPANWTRPALDSGAKAGVRWKLVGNAVSTPLMKWVGTRLASPGKYDSSNDEPLGKAISWPTAAWGNDECVFQSPVSEWPKALRYRDLDGFLRFPTKPLSLKAASGFFNRLKASCLRRPKEFDEAMKKHIRMLKNHGQESDLISMFV
jgi:DNA (cytosine-5)-methyltransferase 1